MERKKWVEPKILGGSELDVKKLKPLTLTSTLYASGCHRGINHRI